MLNFEDGDLRGLLLMFVAAMSSCSGGGAEVEVSSTLGDRKAGAGGEGGNKPQAAGAASDLPAGRWFKMRTAAEGSEGAGAKGDSPRGQGDFAELGYAGAFEASGDFSGAIVHDPSRVEPGLTLFCSGHDTSVLLIDMEGEVVHHWHLDFDEIFPDPLPFKAMEFHSEFVRRAWPFPNGDLLAIFEYTGVVRVDVDGKLIWALANQSHHDFEVQGDGTIAVLDIERRKRGWVRKRYGTPRFRKGIVDSHVVFLSADGEVLRKISIFEAIHRSRFASLLSILPPEPADIFHANSVDVIDAVAAEGHPLFEGGDILVSLRNPSTVVLIDGETEEVKWISRGLTTVQHQASFLPAGSVLLLDNGGGNKAFPLKANRSRVIEIDPDSQEILWRYPHEAQTGDFFTAMLGYVERLPGGNTLITESMQGHLIEVSPEAEVVWEYYSPYRAGDDNELITTLMGGRRIPRAALPFLDE